MWVAFANAKATHIFSANISAYMLYLMIQVFIDSLTNDIVSFEQLGPGCYKKVVVVQINPFMSNGLFYINSLDQFISLFRVSC